MSEQFNQLWMLPKTWRWVTMGDVSTIVGGGTPATNDAANFGGAIPWITPADLTNHTAKYIYHGSRFITEKGLSDSGARWLPRGSVLFSSRAPIGYTAIAAQDVTTNQGFKSFALAPEMVPDYAYHWLKSAKRIAEEMASGTTFLELSGAKAAHLPMPLPPAREQTRISEKLEELLSDFDAGVAELKAAQQKLQRYRQSLLKAAVEGALTAEWRQKNPPTETSAELLQRILRERRARWEEQQLAKFAAQGKAAPKGWEDKYPEPQSPKTEGLPALPEGWVRASVDQLAIVVRGASPRPAGDPRFFGGSIPWITVGSLTADEEMFLDKVDQFVTALGRDASRYIEPDILLLTNSGATLGVPKITRIGGCINDGSVALLDVSNPLRTYLYWFLRTQTRRLRSLNQGAAQPNLNTDIVKQIHVPLCSADEMRKICELLSQQTSTLNAYADGVESAFRLSGAQRQNILRAAFRGELVPQDSNDEPASALLERLRADRDVPSRPERVAKKARRSGERA